MRIRNSGIALTLLASTLLAGCGGGGGGGGSSNAGPVASALSFPLQSAQKALAANGLTKSFTVSITTVSGTTVIGPCSGSGSVTTAPATTLTTFEGKTALSAVSTVTTTIAMSVSPACPAATIAQTSTDFFDTNFVPLGSNIVNGDYDVFLAPPTVPTSVKVGDTGTIGTENSFTDSTKTTGNGTTVISYVIEADTSTTAIVNLISRLSDAAGNLSSTEQDRFRITAIGALTPISADVQFTNGSRATLTYN